MNSVAKRLIKSTLRRLGYEIRQAGMSPPSMPELWPWVRDTQNIRTVIDIGAHKGDFAAFLSSYFKPSATYAFEPLAACVPQLDAKVASIPNFHVFNVALSDHSGVGCLYENSSGPSSSFLRVGEIHKGAFPETAGETPTAVQVRALDEILDPHSLDKNVLIKVDVQGLEDRVICGGRKVFSAAQCVLIEMSFVAMFESQSLFEEVHSLLTELGFRLAGIKNQIHSPRSGQPLFAHCFYLRSDLPFIPAVSERS